MIEFLKDRAGPYLTLSPHCLTVANSMFAEWMAEQQEGQIHQVRASAWSLGKRWEGRGQPAGWGRGEPQGRGEAMSKRRLGAVKHHHLLFPHSCPDGINQGPSAWKYQSTLFYSSSLELNYVVRIGQSRNGKDQAG